MTGRKVPFLDLRIPRASKRRLLGHAIERVFCHGRFILGPEVARLQRRLAAYCGRRFAVGVNSGTDAVFLALKSLGIKAGDEVITTSLSWIATANAITLSGATPVFADIGEDLNIDPRSVERLITRRTKAILPVHYTGKICRIDRLMRIAKAHKLYLVEDAAQAFGATHFGRRAGAFGTLACFSMNPMKVFAACGEAGMIVIDDPHLNERLLALRHNGMVNKEICIEPSHNGRLDTIQAAILLERLKDVPEIIRKRRYMARRYSRTLQGIIDVPVETQGQRDCYYTYTIRADRRDQLKAYLEKKGIEAKIQHPYLMPQQPAYCAAAKGSWPNARRLVKRILSLPCNETLSLQKVDYVANCIKKFYR